MQLTQWRHFEEDQNNPTQMAKYFSSPSRSQPSVYSQEEIYYLLGENNSMKKLLTEVTRRFDTQIWQIKKMHVEMVLLKHYIQIQNDLFKVTLEVDSLLSLYLLIPRRMQ